MSREGFIEASTRFTAWCQEALVFWAERAADLRGGFAEHLSMDGEPDFDHVRRVRVQARIAYVYAHAAYLGWYDGAKAASDHAWAFATGPGSAGGDFIAGIGPRGCAHLVEGDGQMFDDVRDTYAQAFILLAGAWRYKAFGDKAALELADDTIDFLDTHLKAENGGWFEALPGPQDTRRRQNPHMHLFEAFLALHEATQDSKYLQRADKIFTLFEVHFFDKDCGILLEFFKSDWQPAGDGGPLEPGHMMEWCWLLRQYQRQSGKDMSAYADALYAGAMKYGRNAELGLLCDAVNVDGAESRPTSRTWPQTELIKASIAQAEAGEMEKLAAATSAVNALFEHYLSPAMTGGWVDKLAPRGTVISKVMPTSTFYHLMSAAAEADRLGRYLDDGTAAY